MQTYGYNLIDLVEQTKYLKQIYKSKLHRGDRLFVKTVRSVYVILVLGNGCYLVTGGWFDRKELSPMKVTISGCTWGGSAIKIDIVAACGMRLEFGNRLVTSSIQKIFYFPYGSEN